MFLGYVVMSLDSGVGGRVGDGFGWVGICLIW